MTFPATRMRRLRRTAAMRRLVRETVVTPDDLIYPLFVDANLSGRGDAGRRPIQAMPGQFQWSEEALLDEVERALELGLSAVMLFGIPKAKDAQGSDTWDEDDGVIARATRAVKTRFGDDLVLITDVCFCQYTDHGHCGVLTERGFIDNDRTLENLARQATAHAAAGADMLAPSGMIDGMVEVMRAALETDQFHEVPIMAYSAKFASAFYGPFREAAGGSAPGKGDRKYHQMDPANGREAQRELELDDLESADILMVKPAMTYLDVIAKARMEFLKPLAAYNVSGEYSMVMAAAEKGWLDADEVMAETLLSIKRAGADLILTYFAPRFAKRYRAQMTHP